MRAAARAADRFRTARALSVAVLALLLLAATATAASLERPKSAKAHNQAVREFRADVKVIALVPLKMPRTPHREQVQAEFDALFASKLEANEFEVVPMGVYAGHWDHKVRELGGIYDPITGKIIEDKYQAALAYTRDRVREEYPVDAYLYPEITSRNVSYVRGLADWDANREKVHRQGGLGLISAQGEALGLIRALSLKVQIRDNDDRVLFENVAGVQLAEKYGDKGREALEADEILVNEAFNKTAIHLALRHTLYEFRTLSDDIRIRKKKTQQ